MKLKLLEKIIDDFFDHGWVCYGCSVIYSYSMASTGNTS